MACLQAQRALELASGGQNSDCTGVAVALLATLKGEYLLPALTRHPGEVWHSGFLLHLRPPQSLRTCLRKTTVKQQQQQQQHCWDIIIVQRGSRQTRSEETPLEALLLIQLGVPISRKKTQKYAHVLALN